MPLFPSRRWLKASLANVQTALTNAEKTRHALQGRYLREVGYLRRANDTLNAQAQAAAGTIEQLHKANDDLLRELDAAVKAAEVAHTRADEWQKTAEDARLQQTAAGATWRRVAQRNTRLVERLYRLVRLLWASRRKYQGQAETLAEACDHYVRFIWERGHEAEQ